jgi:hypothetical protein
MCSKHVRNVVLLLQKHALGKTAKVHAMQKIRFQPFALAELTRIFKQKKEQNGTCDHLMFHHPRMHA